MSRRALLAFAASSVLLVAACGGAGGPSPARAGPPPRLDEREAPRPSEAGSVGFSREPTQREAKILRELMSDAERVRGLRFARPVTMQVQDQARIESRIREDIEPDEIAVSRERYIALGLLAPDIDVVALMLRVLGEQIVGYYDPEAHLYVVRDDVMARLEGGAREGDHAPLDEARSVLVHELVHALQDQRLGLGERTELERSTDAENAFHAVVEGDATLAMLAFLLTGTGADISQLLQNQSAVRAMMRQAQGPGSDELARAPAIVRVPLISSYIDGLFFCAELRESADWSLVDHAHLNPPVSTEQVLHPLKYLAGEGPDPIEVPRFPGLEGTGLVAIEDDTLGELELNVYFLQRSSEANARRASEGWGGDRLRVYLRDGRAAAAIWFTSWDDENQALEAEEAARRVASGAGDPARQHLARVGRALLISRGLEAPELVEVNAAFEAFARALPPQPPNLRAP